jgi:hypothetical protein
LKKPPIFRALGATLGANLAYSTALVALRWLVNGAVHSERFFCHHDEPAEVKVPQESKQGRKDACPI